MKVCILALLHRDVVIDHCSFPAPSNSPQNVTLRLASSTTINFTWDEVPHVDRNGLIITYEVYAEPLETFEHILITHKINTTNMSVLLENLHPFVNYNISVRAYTSMGTGPFSNSVIVKTLQDRTFG